MEKNLFIANSADVLGKLKIGKDVSIWFQSVLRGDYNTITIGDRSNIQDGTVVHVDADYPVSIGNDVTVGHRCIIHGCTLEDNTLIGMGSTIMNGARIKKNTIVGANSLVTENKEFPENSLVMGSPAKVIRTLTKEEIDGITRNAALYVENKHNYQGKEYAVVDGYVVVPDTSYANHN